MLLSSQHLIVLTSPPATGKTYWISLLRNAFHYEKILVISPLRALADECRSRWGEKIVVMTPEEWLGNKTLSDFVIIDEFHLFFYWGDTFRPLMWEVFYEISEKASLTFLLTATLSEKMKEQISLFNTQFDSIIWKDHGNQILKYKPQVYIKAPSKKWVMKEIESECKGIDTKLIFCKYRQEVFDLEKRLASSGHNCLTCVGGESKYMKEKLQRNPTPDFIISTTVLSHGVNLPNIRRIYFLYRVENLDFWIQMVARGGRKGESYKVFSLDSPQGLDWGPWQNSIRVLWHSIKRKFSPRSFLSLISKDFR